MKVLIAVHRFLPGYSGGTETLVLGVARQLKARGFDVCIFAADPALAPGSGTSDHDEYEIRGIRIFRLYATAVTSLATAPAQSEYLNPRARAHFRQLIEDFNPDIVHIFHFHGLGVGLIDVSLERSLPVFFTPTDFWIICPTMSLTLWDGSECPGPMANGGNCFKHLAIAAGGVRASVIKRIPVRLVECVAWASSRSGLPGGVVSRNLPALAHRRKIIAQKLGLLTKIFSPTEIMTQLLLGDGVDPGQVVKCPFGIELEGFDALVPRPHRPDGIVVGFIGTLRPLKGCLVLLEALKTQPILGLTVKIYGRETDDPVYFKEVSSRAAALPFVHLAGTFPPEELSQVLAGIDVLVVPSIWDENTPLVVLNALAAKCPVIGSDVTGINAVISHEYNGLLFPKGDGQALQGCLERISTEPGLLKTLSANCQPPRSAKDYVDTLVEHYQSAVSVGGDRVGAVPALGT